MNRVHLSAFHENSYSKPTKSGRPELVLTPLEVFDTNIEALRYKLMHAFFSAETQLKLYVPKVGQSQSDVKFDKGYEIIYNEDARHNHESPELADYIPIRISDSMFLEKGSLQGGFHSHIYLG